MGKLPFENPRCFFVAMLGLPSALIMVIMGVVVQDLFFDHQTLLFPDDVDMHTRAVAYYSNNAPPPWNLAVPVFVVLSTLALVNDIIRRPHILDILSFIPSILAGQQFAQVIIPTLTELRSGESFSVDEEREMLVTIANAHLIVGPSLLLAAVLQGLRRRGMNNVFTLGLNLTMLLVGMNLQDLVFDCWVLMGITDPKTLQGPALFYINHALQTYPFILPVLVVAAFGLNLFDSVVKGTVWHYASFVPGGYGIYVFTMVVLPASHSLVGAAPDVYFGVLEGIGYGHIQTLAAMSFFVGQQALGNAVAAEEKKIPKNGGRKRD